MCKVFSNRERLCPNHLVRGGDSLSISGLLCPLHPSNSWCLIIYHYAYKIGREPSSTDLNAGRYSPSQSSRIHSPYLRGCTRDSPRSSLASP